MKAWSILALTFIHIASFAQTAQDQGEPRHPITNFDCTLGAKPIWIRSCPVSLTTGRHGRSRTCIATPPPGFVMLNAEAVPTSVNNGDLSMNIIQANQKFNWSEDVETAFKDLQEDLAEGEYNKPKGKKSAKLNVEMKSDMEAMSKEAVQFDSNQQVAQLRASTNGRDRFDRRRSWSKGYVALYVKCIAPGNMVDQLAVRYHLQNKTAQTKPPTAKATPVIKK